MTSKSYLQAMVIIQIALLAGVCILLGTAVFVMPRGLSADSGDPLQNPIVIAAPLIAAACIGIQYWIYQKRIASLDSTKPLSDRLNDYRATFILSWALLEGPAIFSVMVFLLTGYSPTLVLSFLLLFLMARLRPSRDKLLREVPLSLEEQAKISDPEAVLY